VSITLFFLDLPIKSVVLVICSGSKYLITYSEFLDLNFSHTLVDLICSNTLCAGSYFLASCVCEQKSLRYFLCVKTKNRLVLTGINIFRNSTYKPHAILFR